MEAWLIMRKGLKIGFHRLKNCKETFKKLKQIEENYKKTTSAKTFANTILWMIVVNEKSIFIYLYSLFGCEKATKKEI